MAPAPLAVRSLPAFLVVAAVALGGTAAAGERYELAFSTLLGGATSWEHARDVCVDGEGNVIVVGGTKSTDFPTTPGAFQRVQQRTGLLVGSGGYCDAFVSKFSPDGELLWSTLLGGPNYDRAYGVEVDADGNVLVCGRGGSGFPVTDGALQTEFRGSDKGIYGMQNGFVAKLKADGSGLIWATFVGTNSLCRDLAVDRDGHVYVALDYAGRGPKPPRPWFRNALQPEPAGGRRSGPSRSTATAGRPTGPRGSAGPARKPRTAGSVSTRRATCC